MLILAFAVCTGILSLGILYCMRQGILSGMLWNGGWERKGVPVKRINE